MRVVLIDDDPTTGPPPPRAPLRLSPSRSFSLREIIVAALVALSIGSVAGVSFSTSARNDLTPATVTAASAQARGEGQFQQITADRIAAVYGWSMTPGWVDSLPTSLEAAPAAVSMTDGSQYSTCTVVVRPSLPMPDLFCAGHRVNPRTR